MKHMLLACAALLIAACSVSDQTAAETPPEAPPVGTSVTPEPVPAAEPEPEPEPEMALPPEPVQLPSCATGIMQQGGLLFCTGRPGGIIKMDGKPVAKFDETGRASIGLAQTAPASVKLTIPYLDGSLSETLTIAPRHDEYREITGLDCDKVDARSQEQKDHAARAWVQKQEAFKSFNPGAGFWNGTVRPSDGPASSPFGPVRKYIGVSAVTGEPCESTSIHRGYDMATPIGTPLIAPADGVVLLSDELYYEGNAIFLDHGQGLVSIFMHLSEMDVEPGDIVKAGDVIGKTGNTGRTTGPHLHWSVKWRNTATDDRDGDFYIDPAFLLNLP